MGGRPLIEPLEVGDLALTLLQVLLLCIDDILAPYLNGTAKIREQQRKAPDIPDHCPTDRRQKQSQEVWSMKNHRSIRTVF